MALLMDTPEISAASKVQNEGSASRKDEMTICVETINEQKSPMSEALKSKVRANADSLKKIFEDTIQEKGEFPLEKAEWKNENEVTVTGLSPMTLHSFVLKAEQLGKKISYERTLKVKITD